MHYLGNLFELLLTELHRFPKQRLQFAEGGSRDEDTKSNQSKEIRAPSPQSKYAEILRGISK